MTFSHRQLLYTHTLIFRCGMVFILLSYFDCVFSTAAARLSSIQLVFGLQAVGISGWSSFFADMGSKMTMVAEDEALKGWCNLVCTHARMRYMLLVQCAHVSINCLGLGRDEAIKVSPVHTFLKNPTVEPFPENMRMAMFGESVSFMAIHCCGSLLSSTISQKLLFIFRSNGCTELCV